MVLFVGKNETNAINLYEKGFNIDEIFTNRRDSYVFKYFKNKVKVSLVKDLKKQLKRHKYNLILFSNFKEPIPKEISNRFFILNIHYSPYPSFKHLNTIENSFKSESFTGISFHRLNSNEVFFKKEIPVKNLTYREYEEKIKNIESNILPSLIYDLMEQYSLA